MADRRAEDDEEEEEEEPVNEYSGPESKPLILLLPLLPLPLLPLPLPVLLPDGRTRGITSLYGSLLLTSLIDGLPVRYRIFMACSWYSGEIFQ